MPKKDLWIPTNAFSSHMKITPGLVRRYCYNEKIEPGHWKKVAGKIYINKFKAANDLKRNRDRVHNRPSRHRPPKKQPEKPAKKPPKQTNTPKKTGKQPTDFDKLSTIKVAGFEVIHSLTDAQRLDANYKAALRKLEVDEKAGRSIDLEDLRIKYFNEGRKIRDRLLIIPGRIGALLAASDDPNECEELVKSELLMVCEEIANSAGEDL